MKRTATTLALLAGFGGGCVAPGGTAPKESAGGFGTVSRGSQVTGYQGPQGEPVMARGSMPGAPASQPTAMFRKYTPPGTTGVQTAGYAAHVPGTATSAAWTGKSAAGGIQQANFGGGCGPGGCGPTVPPQMPGGIYPTPGMGPPGAVAAVGALGAGGGQGIPNGRASVKFTSPAGMKVTWQLPGGGFNDEASGLTAPKEYNFTQGQVYRLRLTQILPNHPGKAFYPTLEVAAANPKTIQFLAHACVPVTFTNDDFDHAVSGNLVVKVIYLPDRDNQDFLSVAGAEEVNSTRLEPGIDPVAEAQRKGSVLAITRLGNIDLENRVSPVMNAPPGGFMALPPGALPPGAVPGAMPPPAPTAPEYPAGTSSVGTPQMLLPQAPKSPAAPQALPSAPPATLPPIK